VAGGDDGEPWDRLASGEWRGSSGALEPVSGGSRYKERSVLGQGGMGRVVVAEDTVLRREVALKESLGAADGPEAERLRREARITAALDHPGIVPVFDLGEDEDGRPHFVMRLVRGRSLGAAIAEASTYEERLPLVRSVLSACEAVAFAHDAGVVHRDIKPDNILVGAWGETQVMDWGLARTLDDDEWDAVVSRDFRTKAGAILGTPAYMSPEQAGGGDVGPSTDVWALGAVLYEVLSGQRPFRGPSQKEMLAQILSGSRPSLRSLVPGVDPALEAIVTRALASDVADRYPDAGALARELERWFDGRRREEGAVRPRARGWVLGALSLLLAAALGWALDEGPSEAPPPSPDQALAQDGLVLRAWDALSRGERVEAERYAAAALSRGEHPGARGVLAATGSLPVPRLIRAFTMEGCEQPVAAPRAEFVICSGADGISRYEVDGARSWTLPSEVDRVHIGAGAEVVAGFSRRASRWVALQGATGKPLVRNDMGFSPSLPRPGSSLDPLVFLTLQNGRSDSYMVSPIAHGARSKLRTGCESRGLIEYAVYLGDDESLEICGDRSVMRSAGSSAEELLPATGRDSISWTADVDPTGRWLLIGEVEGGVELIDLQERRRVLLVEPTPRMVRRVALAPDITRVVSLDTVGEAWVTSVEEPEARFRIPGKVAGVAFQSDGSLLVVRGARAEIWEVPVPAGGRRSLPDGVMAMAWEAEGLAVAAAGVHVLDGTLGRRAYLPIGDMEPTKGRPPAPPDVRSLDWTSSGLLFAGQRIGVQRFDPRLGRVEQLSDAGEFVMELHSGLRLVLGTYGQDPGLVRPDGSMVEGMWLPGWTGMSGEPLDGARRALLTGRDGTLVLVEDGDPPTLTAVPEPAGGGHAIATADAKTLYLSTRDGLQVRGILEAPETARTIAPDLYGAPLLLEDESAILVGTMDGVVHAVSLPDGVVRLRLPAHERRISALVASPDGQRLATGSWDRSVAVWDLTVLSATREELIAAVEARWTGVPE